jgi:formylmethanofuran dehydrogenase subunit E
LKGGRKMKKAIIPLVCYECGEKIGHEERGDAASDCKTVCKKCAEKKKYGDQGCSV